MVHRLIPAVFLIVMLAFLACETEIPIVSNAGSDSEAALSGAEQIARDLVAQSGWELDEAGAGTAGEDATLQKRIPIPLPHFQRIPLGNDIVHYKFLVRAGRGAYNFIGVHRVVKERIPFRPIRTTKSVLLQHGDYKDFEGMFLPGTRSSHMPDDFGLAMYLAENNVDVWGIDQAWTLVPASVTEHSFMADWGLQKQVDDLRLALAVAMHARMLTGCGWDKLNLLGYSSGVWTGYALLNQETQMRPMRQLVKGLIAADGAIKTDYEPFKQPFQAEYERTKALLDQGIYGDMVPLPVLGGLARNDPDGDSPVFPGFTNFQAAMFLAAGPIFGTVNFHYFAGIWENDLPVDLQYVTIDECFDFMEASVAWEPVRFFNDYCTVTLDMGTNFDNHLGQIQVPIFNITPGGGFAELTTYTTTLLGSSDITSLIVRIHPPGEELLDFGHIDMFVSDEAVSRVWRPILRWIKSHSMPALLKGDEAVLADLE